MKAKIITIEGTDCSGKETQTNKLFEYLVKEGYKVFRTSFPNYESPTGKIVGGAYLGKEEIGECIFEEGAVEVDSIVSSLYYAADRRYNYLKFIKDEIEKNDIVLLDRYVYSNMGHQGSKIFDREERNEFFEKIEELEFKICCLPKPDKVIFLHMPLEYTSELKKNRTSLDQLEKSEEHLKNAEITYLELKDKYNFSYISCVENNKIKLKEEISEEVIEEVKKLLKK